MSICRNLLQGFDPFATRINIEAIPSQEVETGFIFAHTLSQTASMNFNRYANALLRDGVLPSQVMTRIFVEVPTHLNAKQRDLLEQFARLESGEGSPLVQGFWEKAKSIFE